MNDKSGFPRAAIPNAQLDVAVQDLLAFGRERGEQLLQLRQDPLGGIPGGRPTIARLVREDLRDALEAEIGEEADQALVDAARREIHKLRLDDEVQQQQLIVELDDIAEPLARNAVLSSDDRSALRRFIFTNRREDHERGRGAVISIRDAFRRDVELGRQARASEEALGLGLRFAKRGDLDPARAALQRAIELDDKDVAPLAAFTLGALLAQHASLDEAGAVFQRAIDSGHDDYAPAAALGLGLVLASGLDLAPARDAFQRAIDSRHPVHAPHAALHLGHVLIQQGEIASARAAFQRAIDSANPEASRRARIVLGDLSGTGERLVADADDPSKHFLAIAGAALTDSWAKRLDRLPSDVGDRAYDHALDTILSRAQQGVEPFCDEHGRLVTDTIVAYVKHVLNHKLNSAWRLRGPHASSFSDDAQASPAWDDVLDLQSRLELEHREDALLERARDALEQIERRDRQQDAARLREIELALVEHRVADRDQRVIMLRALREWVVDVTADGVRRRYLSPTPWSDIAARISIRSSHARQIYSRTMARLGPDVRVLIDDPGATDVAGAAPTRRDRRSE